MADNNNAQSNSLPDRILSEVSESLKEYVSISAGIDAFVSKTKEALSESKEVDTLLTQIAKESDRFSKASLEKIGNDAFDTASKYGKSAYYLAGFQEASRAGYQNAAELAEAVSAAGGQAEELGVGAKETAAVLGTMISAAHQGSAEAAEAFGDILLLIRQVTDEGKGIDAGSIARYEEACRALNVSLKETKNGITSLRDPMDILKDMSEAYSGLGSDDTRRTNLLDAAGSSADAEALNAVLENYGLYEKMLAEYAQGTGSMAQKASETADSWEGSLQRLSNTWTDTIGNIADSDAAAALVNSLDKLLSVANAVTDRLGSFGTIAIGTGITAFVKNFA